MTNDELRMHIESLHSNMAQLFEQSQKHDVQIERSTVQIERLTQIAGMRLDSIKRLENIATAH